MTTTSPESPLIRPPSEWRSLLVRVTRGCKWNRCRFCGIYPALGEAGFSVRSVAEVKGDIDQLAAMRPRAKTAFFGDADPLAAGLDRIAELARYLRRRVTTIERLTCYARASTLARLPRGGIRHLAAAGLDRVHLGLESGDPETLRFHRKGQSPAMIREVAARLRRAQIEVSMYVLLGLGGRDRWRRHIEATAGLLNETIPDFIRLRRLWLYGAEVGGGGTECPLRQQVRSGEFLPQTPEGTVLEVKLLLENLDGINSFLACDHANNYVNVSGRLQSDRAEMLATVNDFLARPEEERRAHYQAVGSGI